VLHQTPKSSPSLVSHGNASENKARNILPRIPIRWRWTALVSFAIIITVAILYMIVLDIERKAWLESQAEQAELQVDILTDELKLPMLSGVRSETSIALQRFLQKVPAALAVLIHYPDGSEQAQYAPGDAAKEASQHSDIMMQHLSIHDHVIRLPIKALWYAKVVLYDKTPMGTVAVRFSEQTWQRTAEKLTRKIFIAAVLVILSSSLLAFWLAGRMSKPIERLAEAAAKVSDGDYHVQLPIQGNDELSDALSQFNSMVQALAHKEELRNVFGRYLNPKLVSNVFEQTDTAMENHRQEVSILFADMIQFTSFSESNETTRVIDVLNQYFEIFHRIISHYGGHVDKYIGDAVMAVFNHPVHDPLHIRQAATAGLAMLLACQRLAIKRENGDTIRFRMGLNCGQTIVGNIGASERLEYTVIGDAVNVASRMSGLGTADELIVPRHTFDLLGDGFSFYAVGMYDIKGLREPIEAGRVRLASKAARQQLEQVVDAAFQQLQADASHATIKSDINPGSQSKPDETTHAS